MQKIKRLQRARNNPANVWFADLCKLAEHCGFQLRGSRGSHRVYTHPQVREILNFQDVGGKAKAYQVRQFLAIIDRYEIHLEDSNA
jgi:HicA-like toxin of HicAB toxin-antitoxin system